MRWEHVKVVSSSKRLILSSVIGSDLSPGEEVLHLLRTCSPFNLEDLKKQEEQLPPEDSK